MKSLVTDYLQITSSDVTRMICGSCDAGIQRVQEWCRVLAGESGAFERRVSRQNLAMFRDGVEGLSRTRLFFYHRAIERES